MLMLPEILVIVTAFLVLAIDLVNEGKGSNNSGLSYVAMLGLGAALTALILGPQQGSVLGGQFVLDSVSWWFKCVFLIAGIATIGISKDLLEADITDKSLTLKSPGEYLGVLLFTLTGMLYLVSSRNIVSFYVSLELATIPLFVLASWQKNDSLSQEAGLKYLIFGALSSAFLLFGLGLLYGLSGSTDLVTISEALKASPGLWLSVGFLTAGIGFKLTLVPFHLWAADVYQGAPTPITAFLSVASKATGLGALFLIYFIVFKNFLGDWGLFLAIIATLTMTVGNLIAIVQTNIKRFMAFSAISQAGYFLMGFLGPSNEGVSSMLFYLLVYTVTNLTVFAVITLFQNSTGKQNIEDYKGLSITNPILALVMLLGLFSLAGIPPLSGFVGKFFLFSVAAQAGYYWLVVIAAVNSTVSLYYYLKIIRQMYIEKPTDNERSIRLSPTMLWTLTAVGAATVLMGIIPFFHEIIHQQTAGWLALF